MCFSLEVARMPMTDPVLSTKARPPCFRAEFYELQARDQNLTYFKPISRWDFLPSPPPLLPAAPTGRHCRPVFIGITMCIEMSIQDGIIFAFPHISASLSLRIGVPGRQALRLLQARQSR